ncbi:MAG: branched-chain amino acid ABC transporter permease [Betaproteobacteria bacterium]|jgi:branched-chain amino acid transport system permease protein|nr:branched-chain amino acid ABC transporter permease [Betaproteobacteria bacterium]NBX90373.1 branched-chain amino acid ABC transporter permease [Betaproteobacteria bacterium]
MNFSIFLQILWTGIAVSSYVVLFSVAFSLILKVVKIWNFAQAGLMCIAFYAMYVGFNYWALPKPLSFLLGYLLTLGASWLLHHFGIEKLRQRNSTSLTFFIFTLVLSEMMTYVFALAFGTEPLSLTKSIMSPVHMVGGIVISEWDIQALAMTSVVLVLLHVFMNRTKLGQFMSAAADNPSLARLYGINVPRLHVYAFAVAALLMTLGMYLFGQKVSMIPNTPLQMMLFAVIATLLGGMGNVFGAAWAAVALSLLQALSIFVIPSQWQSLILYVFLFVTILFFPQGFSVQKLMAWIGGKKA